MSIPPDAVTPPFLRGWPLPQPGGSKHSRGHVVIIGGSSSTPGAVLLAGVAALRVGAGVLALVAPTPVAIPLAIAVPEASVTGYDERLGWDDRLTEAVAGADAVLLGPGIDDAEVAQSLLRGLLSCDLSDTAVALDAYALGVLAGAPDLKEHLPASVVLSPNVQEAARLLSRDESELAQDSGAVALELADTWHSIVTYQSTIARPDGTVRSIAAGHAGLGTSGSGDVLAGAIVGLLARGADAEQAATWATYLHAAAGDRLAPRVGRLGFLARELLTELPALLTEIQT
jgi:ADP-dependent NAD(P)H-hydrate dehydratase